MHFTYLFTVHTHNNFGLLSLNSFFSFPSVQKDKLLRLFLFTIILSTVAAAADARCCYCYWLLVVVRVKKKEENQKLNLAASA